MNWTQAIGRFISDKQDAGDFNSPLTARAYRDTLERLAEVSKPRRPDTCDREDCKRCLARWGTGNTRGTRRAHLVSFFDWMMEEGYRESNPARATRKSRRKPTRVIRWTRDEAVAFLAAAQSPRERRVAYLGVCQGLRRAELLDLRGDNFRRPGFVRVVGKGDKERWLPLIADVVPIAEEIRATVGPLDYVIPAQRWAKPNTVMRDVPERALSEGSLATLVEQIARRAGLGHATPHVMRRAFADFIQGERGDLKLTQAMLGHAHPSTTDLYLSDLSPERLRQLTAGMRFGGSDPSGSGATFGDVQEAGDFALAGASPTKRMYDGTRVLEPLLARWWAAAALESCEALAA